MCARVQTLNLAGNKFVVLERGEYDRLRAMERAAAGENLPPWPPADAEGNRPALEFARKLSADWKQASTRRTYGRWTRLTERSCVQLGSQWRIALRRHRQAR